MTDEPLDPATVKFQSPQEYEDKDVIVENEKQHVPKFSQWELVCSCCGCKYVYFPEIKVHFCNQWECRPLFPSLVTTLFCLSFALGIWSVFENLKNLKTAKIAIIVSFSFAFFVWFISYFCAVCRSPGYLPFYWAVEKHDRFTFEQQMDGVITNNDQFNFANYNARPERGSLSRQARRLVMKADHVCKWIGNWVGLKNYKFFFSFLIWSFIYFLYWFAILIIMILKLSKNGWKSRVDIIGMLVFSPVAFCFFCFLTTIFLRHSRYTCRNTSTLQEVKLKNLDDKHNYYDMGCWENCSQVMGPKKCCLCWFTPIPLPRPTDGFNWIKNGEPAQI